MNAVMTDEEFIISSLKRIYDECEEVLDTINVQGQALLRFPGIAEKYNETLGLVKDQYVDEDIIQNLESIEPKEPVNSKSTYSDNYRKLESIKINTMTMADYIGVEMKNFQSSPSTDGYPEIKLIQKTNVDQSVNLENIHEVIERTPLKEVERQELRDVFEEYQNEVEKRNPDKSKLKNLYKKMAGYSETIALQAGAYALQRGIDIVLG